MACPGTLTVELDISASSGAEDTLGSTSSPPRLIGAPLEPLAASARLVSAATDSLVHMRPGDHDAQKSSTV